MTKIEFEIGHEKEVILDGYIIPGLKVFDSNEPGKYQVVLDRRFAFFVNKEDATGFFWFLANSMAVAAGWSCYGENSTLINPYEQRYYSNLPLEKSETVCNCPKCTEERSHNESL